MKKIFVLLFFLSNICFAQITISGSPIAGLNQTFTLSSAGAFSSACAGGITPPDAGTNIYAVNDPNYASNYLRYCIVRRGGYWTIEGHYGGGAYVVYYKYLTISPNPPCTVSWEIFTGNCYYSNGIVFTGNYINTLVLSGLCFSFPVNSSTITPNFINFPQRTTGLINTTPSPQKGMIVFDSATNEMKVYNGFAWKVISVL